MSVAYVVSAILAKPDWGKSATHLVVPHGQITSAYLLAVVGTVGTTITPWGQAFIQSYCADKRLGPEHLRTSRFDVGLGAFLTNSIAAFIVIAAAATLWAHGERSIPTRRPRRRRSARSPAMPPRPCSRSGCSAPPSSGSASCR